jgi:murein DD-endopeptidase MepM/ murein hydrolase activator NlpD
MLISEGTDKTRSIRLPDWSVKLTWLLLSLMILATAAGILSYSRLVAQESVIEDLQTENSALRSYAERVRNLEADLKTNRILLRRMMELAGITEDILADSSGAPADTSGAYQGADSLQLGAAPEGISDSASAIPKGFPMKGYVSRGFAPEEAQGARRHLGIDIAGKEGTPVFATADGIVEFADWDETFGQYLIIDHQTGYKTHYGHNRALLVGVGDTVRRGELVALSGNTGRSSAPHLHYEIRKNGEPQDPEIYTGEFNQNEREK